MRCALCFDTGRVAGRWSTTDPCPRCEPESVAADGTPTCRLCGGVTFTIPGQRANLGWLCGRCSPSYRREHRATLAASLRTGPIDWTRPVEGWLLW